jgi:deoxycytidine triphosphate deaminase
MSCNSSSSIGFDRFSIVNNDAHIDPGFYGHITLEIVNMHRDSTIDLISDAPICQLFLGTLISESERVYNGKYQNQEKPTIYRP